eukprot:191040_1
MWKSSMARTFPRMILKQPRLTNYQNCTRFYGKRYARFRKRRRIFDFADPVKRRRLYIGGSVFGLFLLTRLESVEFTGRKRFKLWTSSMEKHIGEQSVRQFEQMIDGNILPKNHPMTRLARQVVDRVVSSNNSLSRINWDVVVIDSNTPNASAFSNGSIVVFSGLFDIAQNEHELAAVLAHEMGHVVAGHMPEKAIFAVLLFVALFVIGDVGAIGTQLAIYMLNLPFSRKLESEADYIGLEIMTNACYDPRGAISFFERLSKNPQDASNKIPSFMSTHPASSERALEARKRVSDELLGRYEEKCVMNNVRLARDRFNREWSD